MTWHRFMHLGGLRGVHAATAALVALAAGCGSESHAAFLRLLAPDADAVLTMADDLEPEVPGLQIDVSGESGGLVPGSQVELFIDDDQQDDRAGVDTTGKVMFEGVTVPPGVHTLTLRTSTGLLSSEPRAYTFRALVITSPKDGQMFTLADDEDATKAGVQVSVTVEAHAVDSSEGVTLLVDAEPAGGSRMPDDKGRAVFAGVTLPSGPHTLGAVVPGEPPIGAEEISVDVRDACAAIDFVSPKAPATGDRLTLGGNGQCPTDTDAPFEVTVEVSTDAGDGQPIELFVNGMPVASGEVQGSNATFEGVALTNLASANALRVEVMNADGITCGKDFPVDVYVDCAGPDCTLTSPTPVDYIDAKDELTLFLNAAHERKGGFDIGVTTDRAGQTVSLIVDRDEKSALDVTSVKQGSKAIASFKTVELDEGAHWLQGRCEDAAGNVNFTKEVHWVVDTVRCEATVQAPDADTLFVPADDDDANPANGTQTVVTTSVTGGDCIAQRAGPCDPADGLTDEDFVPYGGDSPLLSTVTLDDDLVAQTLCVEIRDRAENVGLATRGVRFRGSPPMLELESPSDGESFNATGSAGHTKDANTSSGACDAAFSVACTEVGTPVDLHFDDATGTVFATATCTAPGPAGFAGRAQVTKAFDGGGQTATIVATQTIEGDSGKTVTGSSVEITISGDCIAPGPSFQGDPCESGFIGIANPSDTVTKDVVVLAGAADAATVVLDVSNSDGTTSSDATPDSVIGPQRKFDAVFFGGEGTVTLTASVTDDFDNLGTAECSAEIVQDVPTLSVTSPTDNQQFGPGDGCNAGAGVFGVPVTATVDTDTNREVTVTVNGGTPVGVPVTGGSMVAACVAVPDDTDQGGASTIEVRVESTASGAFRTASRIVNVRTVEITDPTANQVLVAADDCGGAGFAAQATAAVDAAHMGANYVIASPTSSTMVMGSVAGASVSGCLDLDEGPQTITVSIDGTVYAAVDVVVASMNPGTEIVLTPSCPDTASATYRTDALHLDWDTLANLEDYPGQFQSYTLRCAHTPVASAPTPEDWWNTVATSVALGAPPVTPASGLTAADIPFRTGETRYCALRAADGADQLTPITNAAEVTCDFRSVVLFSSTTNLASVGLDATVIGDVDGDGIDDVLVGGNAVAYLFFGSANPAALDDGPDVTFTAPANFGNRVAGIGDFNGDGRNDFAIAWRSFSSSRGQAFVFFGRAMGTAWPSSVDLSGACAADVCIRHSTASARLGAALSPAGDFDGDGTADLAMAAANCPSTGTEAGQLLVIRGKNYEARSCGSDTDCRASENCDGAPTGTCVLDVAGAFWGLDYEVPSGNWLNAPSGTPVTLQGWRLDGDSTVARFGCGLAAFGAFDSTTGADLVVSAPGSDTLSPKLFFLSGHPYSAGSGIETLAFNRLGFRPSTNGTPSGTPFETGGSKDFGLPIAAAGNVYDDAGLGNPDKPDLLVKRATNHEFWIYLGDSNFAPADRVQVTGPNPSDIGISLAPGMHPTIAHPSLPTPDVIGDLDGDGRVDLCAGSGFAPSAGAAYLWYSDALDASAGDGVISDAEASHVEPPAGTNTTQRVLRYVGDLNGDDEPDLLVGDPGEGPLSTDLRGRATLLY